MAVTGDLAGQRYLGVLEHDFRAEGRAGAALAPGAMADRHACRLAGRLEPHRAADATALVVHRHAARLRRRQVDAEAAAPALCRQANRLAAVAARDLAHQGEAKPAAAPALARRGQAIERLEDAFAL